MESNETNVCDSYRDFLQLKIFNIREELTLENNGKYFNKAWTP